VNFCFKANKAIHHRDTQSTALKIVRSITLKAGLHKVRCRQYPLKRREQQSFITAYITGLVGWPSFIDIRPKYSAINDHPQIKVFINPQMNAGEHGYLKLYKRLYLCLSAFICG
jgi:hypothetical protein